MTAENTAKALFNRVPPNCRFEIDDFELEWNYPYPFDFIHARNIEGSVKNHQRLFRQALENLKDGGWLEVAESTVGVFCDDDTIDRAPNLLEWRDRLIEASEKFGKLMGVASRYREWMIEAGFKNVREEIYKVCFNRDIPWRCWLTSVRHVKRCHTRLGRRTRR
jgi:trans-aconitate methyltransferase